MRGWLDDITRGPIQTLDVLKREIRTMAEYKQNWFTLYTKHVFKLEKHPTIAHNDGITAKEIKELSAYAKQYHVELVGCFQSFGHFKNILDIPKYAHLGEVASKEMVAEMGPGGVYAYHINRIADLLKPYGKN